MLKRECNMISALKLFRELVSGHLCNFLIKEFSLETRKDEMQQGRTMAFHAFIHSHIGLSLLHRHVKIWYTQQIGEEEWGEIVVSDTTKGGGLLIEYVTTWRKLPLFRSITR